MYKIFILISLLIIFYGCKKGDVVAPIQPPTTPIIVGENSVTFINGNCSEYNGRKFILNPHNAAYEVNTQRTGIQELSSNPVIVQSMTFTGHGIGTYSIKGYSLSGAISMLALDSASNTCYGDWNGYGYTNNANFFSDSIVVNVTRYDDSGGLIEGTWAGRLGLPITLNPIVIDSTKLLNASGKFSLIRGSDF